MTPAVHPAEKTDRSRLPATDEWDMISKSFPASGIVVLYGPSGSGKTRLMQAAARYASVQKGLVKKGGQLPVYFHGALGKRMIS